MSFPPFVNLDFAQPGTGYGSAQGWSLNATEGNVVVEDFYPDIPQPLELFARGWTDGYALTYGDAGWLDYGDEDFETTWFGGTIGAWGIYAWEYGEAVWTALDNQSFETIWSSAWQSAWGSGCSPTVAPFNGGTGTENFETGWGNTTWATAWSDTTPTVATFYADAQDHEGFEAITVEQVFTINLSGQLIHCVASGALLGQQIAVRNVGGHLPGPFTPDGVYYALPSGSNDMQLSLVEGGTPVVITGTGYGYQYLRIMDLTLYWDNRIYQ